MHTITFSDGRKLENLELNGNNYVAQTAVDDSVFATGMDKVTVTDGDTRIVYHDMILLSNTVRDGKSWIVLEQKSEQKKMFEALESENFMLKAQIQAMSDRNDFIEDCIAEMAMQVYA